MSALSDNAFSPEVGKLGQLVYENAARGIAPRLEFSMEIPFQPFELEDEELETALLLSGIRPGVKSWLELEDSTCSAEVLQSIDGSIRLIDEVHSVEIQKLQFHAIDGRSIAIAIDAEVECDLDDVTEDGILPLAFTATLSTDCLRVATTLDKRLKGDPAAITKEITDVVDLSVYGGLEKVPGGLVFPIKV